jgi:hypothetical protein
VVCTLEQMVAHYQRERDQRAPFSAFLQSLVELQVAARLASDSLPSIPSSRSMHTPGNSVVPTARLHILDARVGRTTAAAAANTQQVARDGGGRRCQKEGCPKEVTQASGNVYCNRCFQRSEAQPPTAASIEPTESPESSGSTEALELGEGTRRWRDVTAQLRREVQGGASLTVDMAELHGRLSPEPDAAPLAQMEVGPCARVPPRMLRERERVEVERPLTECFP